MYLSSDSEVCLIELVGSQLPYQMSCDLQESVLWGEPVQAVPGGNVREWRVLSFWGLKFLEGAGWYRGNTVSVLFRGPELFSGFQLKPELFLWSEPQLTTHPPTHY